MNIEHELQQALRRKTPPPDLTDRVLARLDRPQAGAPRRWMPPAATRWLAAAAAVALVATGASRYYAEQQARLEAERARQDVMLALQITSEALADVQRHVEASLTDTP